MAARRRAKITPPDKAGLAHDEVRVGWSDGPWSGNERALTKSWADSFADPDDRMVPSPTDLNGPDYWFRAEVPGVDIDVQFRLGRTDEHTYVVTGLLLGDPGGTQAITTSNLHRLPIGTIYEGIARLIDAMTTDTLAEKAKPFRGAVPTRGGQRTSDSEIIEVAEVYKACTRERPTDPIKCVAERLGVSSATASRRVARARELGLLREPDPSLQAKLDIPHPTNLESIHTGIKHVGATAHVGYLKAYRKAWVSLDYLQRAIEDRRNDPNPIAQHVEETRNERFKQDLASARRELQELLERAEEDEPPF